MIEEIFGEIVDEFDEEETIFTQVGPHEFIVDGKMPLDDLIAEMDLPEAVFDEVRGTSDTLAGLILELHRKIPLQGEEIVYAQFRFVVEMVEQNRIRRLRLHVAHPEDNDLEDKELE
jgi:CBS domain containing-hemolysin-like protein